LTVIVIYAIHNLNSTFKHNFIVSPQSARWVTSGLQLLHIAMLKEVGELFALLALMFYATCL
jgi:hypothetical protein